ncbi:MAG TPA: HAMP domain-containing histidine kinase [Candidatus Wildermuthbacteria bacterium]|nr:HAMP domain-containing histidine kinase [Candidatus Wildermuthbacteria bacterium]
MTWKEILSELDVLNQCKKYGIPLWQCPNFLFLVMGGIIIFSTLLSYFLGKRYIDEPEVTVLIVILFTIILLILSFIITRSFERLAEASRLKSEFVSIVSHQLRAPISNMKWALDFLMSGRSGKVEDAQLGYFQILKQNSARMEELVADLLVVSRIDQGTLPVKMSKFSFRELLDGIIFEFDSYLKASNVQLKIEGPKILPQLLQNEDHIRDVIQNLLDNAIRYSANSVEEKKRSKIQIRYGKKGNQFFFEIEDNGVGIPKEDQKHIFEKFFRSRNALKQETQGSGLGLYIVKSLIVLAKGRISFKSEQDKGSTFLFTIPMSLK